MKGETFGDLLRAELRQAPSVARQAAIDVHDTLRVAAAICRSQFGAECDPGDVLEVFRALLKREAELSAGGDVPPRPMLPASAVAHGRYAHVGLAAPDRVIEELARHFGTQERTAAQILATADDPEFGDLWEAIGRVSRNPRSLGKALSKVVGTRTARGQLLGATDRQGLLRFSVAPPNAAREVPL